MKKINVKRLATAIIAVILIISLLIFLGKYLVSVIWGISINDTGIVITPSVASECDIVQYNEKIAVANSKGVEFYNKKGEYESDLAFKLYSPYIYVKDKAAVIADLGDCNALVLKKGKQAYKITEQESISSVSVNENGYTAVLTGESGYKSAVVIYDNLGSKIYTWYSGDLYAVDVKISDNNKRFAVVGIDAEDSLKSKVKFFKMNEENPYSEVILDSELAYQLEYSGNNVLVVTDKGLRVISPKGKIKKSYDLNGEALLCFDIKDSKMPVIATSDATGGSRVVVLTSSLREKGSSVIDGQAKLIDSYRGQTAISNGNELFLISSFGNLKAQTNLNKDAKCFKIAEDKKHIFVLSGNSIGVYKIAYGRH